MVLRLVCGHEYDRIAQYNLLRALAVLVAIRTFFKVLPVRALLLIAQVLRLIKIFVQCGK